MASPQPWVSPIDLCARVLEQLDHAALRSRQQLLKRWHEPHRKETFTVGRHQLW